MSATKIDGKAYAERLRAQVAEAVGSLPSQPTLAVVLVGGGRHISAIASPERPEL